MTGWGTTLALAILVAWAVQGAITLAFGSLGATGNLAALGAALAIVIYPGTFVRYLTALLAPVGVMLPALALVGILGRLGYELPGFASWEIEAFLLAYTVFLLCAFGIVPVDLYRYGYAPLPVGGMVLALCLYAALSGQWILALVAVVSQGFWIMKWGSSNWFDYVLHVLLWPTALIALIVRVI